MRELQWNDKIFNVKSSDFDALTLEIFQFQAAANPVYNAYIAALGLNSTGIKKINDIPFFPIRFFRTHEVQTTHFSPELVFESSGTTGTIQSKHRIRDAHLYEQSFTKGFNQFFGNIKDHCILGLLPSYLERKNSSLVYMVNKLINDSGHPSSGFYLDEFDKLEKVLIELEKNKTRTLLIGVSFALLDFAEQKKIKLTTTNIMETGGMKGRREEIVRSELHEQLQSAFGLTKIYSEYGMTELLSQAYSLGNGIFNCPPWMKIMVRDDEDPLDINDSGSGAINVIDLANVYSCSFISTDDVGKLYEDGSFEVLGRMDGSDLRGCSLMVV